jgi:integrase
MTSLSGVYTTAINEWGWLEINPVKKVAKPAEPQGRVRFLSDDERARLLEACKLCPNPILYTVVVVALSTGARKSEILTLKWRQVDFERNVIRLENTKNKERRALPLVGKAHELVFALKTENTHDTDYVFPRPDGRKPVEIKRSWHWAIRKAEIKDFRFHDLRHSAASYLAMNGATLAEIAEVLGHKTLQMVKRYAHMSEQHTIAVVERMNKKIF